jgi:hypothetical protein
MKVLLSVVLVVTLAVLAFLAHAGPDDSIDQRDRTSHQGEPGTDLLIRELEPPPSESRKELNAGSTESTTSVDVVHDWLPSAPKIDVFGATAEEIMKAYWGNRWPEVRLHLDEASGGWADDALSSWVGQSGVELGDRDALLRSIQEIVVRRFRSEMANGMSDIMERRTDLPFWSPGPRREVVFQAVRNAAAAREVALAGPLLKAAVDAVLANAESELDASFDEVFGLAAIADELIVNYIEVDLEGVAEGHAPRVGRLFVNPILATHHMDHAHLEERDRLHIAASIGHVPGERGLWNAAYTLDVRLVPGLEASTSRVNDAVRRMKEWITSLANLELDGH